MSSFYFSRFSLLNGLFLLLYFCTTLLLKGQGTPAPVVTVGATSGGTSGTPTTGATTGEVIVFAKIRNANEQKMLAKLKDIVENSHFANSIQDALSSKKLPIGIVTKIGNVDFVMAVDSARRKPNKEWIFSVYMAVLLPKSDENSEIVFAASDIAFNPKGVGSLSSSRLSLISTNIIPISKDLAIELSKTNGVSNNYIEFDCNGYKSFSLEGKFLFTGGILTKPTLDEMKRTNNGIAPTLVVDGSSKRGKGCVKATLRVQGTNIKNILASLSIDPFKVKGVDNMIFEVNNATLDMSDVQNPASFAFPAGYDGGVAATPLLWQGFFLQSMKVSYLGAGADDKNAPAPNFTANNVLIDETGVSGIFAGNNLLSLENGSLGGWAVSITRLEATLVQSNLTGASLTGKLKVPFLGEEPLGYSAMMEKNNGEIDYSFAVAIVSTQTFDMPAGLRAKLLTGSSITVSRSGVGDARATTVVALLNGSVGSGQTNASFSGITFQNLSLTTAAPYVNGGTFSLVSSTPPKCRGFGISLTNITLTRSAATSRVNLGLNVAVNFTNTGGGTQIGAGAKLDFVVATNTALENGITRRSFTLDRVRVNDIFINCQTNAFGLRGLIGVYDGNPTYGDGFKGSLLLIIKKGGDTTMRLGATAYFGNKEVSAGSTDRFRYFGLVVGVGGLSVPIAPPLYMTGVMGGFAYHMRNGSFNPDYSTLNAAGAPTVTGLNYQPSTMDAVVNFIPDNTIGVLFRAGIAFDVNATPQDPAKSMANGDAMLEVAFQSNGALRYINFQGAIYFTSSMTAKDTRTKGETPDATQKNYATLVMCYDNTNSTLHANLVGYLNMPAIKGSSDPSGRLGEVVLHISPSAWYLYLGRSSAMLGVRITALGTSGVDIRGYFMVGTAIEAMPPLPTEVLNAFGAANTPTGSGRTAAVQTGQGFAFGLHIKASFGGEEGCFYAKFMVMAGLDFMLMNFGPNVTCAGTGSSPGVDGWYAQGQLYAYLAGSVGIDCRFGRYEIFALTIAAALQIKGPNPTWIKGQLAGSYSILNGWVQGRFNFGFEMGEKCVLVSSAGGLPPGVAIIESIKPDNLATAVSVFTSPQVSFNLPLGTEFPAEDLNGTPTKYKASLISFVVSDAGVAIAGTQKWTNNGKVLTFQSTEVLPGEKPLKARVEIKWEKQTGTTWTAVDTEVKEHNFTTGPRPNDVYGNVLYAYPVRNQYNFYKNEASAGYITLNQGQEYLFKSPQDLTGALFTFEARFKQAASNAPALVVPLTYDVAGKQLNFAFPAGLQTAKVYKMTLVKKPLTTLSSTNNTQAVVNTQAIGDSSSVRITSTQLVNTLAEGEKAVYESDFRSSSFSTFVDKMNTWTTVGDADMIHSVGAWYLYKDVNTTENLDDVERSQFSTDKSPYVASLVYGEAAPTQPWIANFQYPNMYQDYGSVAGITVTRNTDFLGVTPLKGIAPINGIDGSPTLDYMLTSSQASSGVAPTRASGVRINYKVPLYAKWDWQELRNQALAATFNNLSYNNNNWVAKLRAYQYQQLINGSYTVYMRYRLPGKITHNSEKVFNITCVMTAP